MTSEKRYEIVCDMLRYYDAANDTAIADNVIKNPEQWKDSTFFPFAASAAKLLIEARENMDRQKTTGRELSAMKRIYKSACNKANEGLHGFFKSAGKWCLCDSYRFIRIAEKPESIPEVDEKRFNPLDIDKCIPDESKFSEEVSLPSLAEIKEYIAEHGYKRSQPIKGMEYEAVPGWWCNPFYMIDMMEALPNGKAHRPKSAISPLYYSTDDGDAIILPVRHCAA